MTLMLIFLGVLALLLIVSLFTRTFAIIPFLGVVVIGYALVVLLGPMLGISEFTTATEYFTSQVFSVTQLPSTNAENPWIVTNGDLFILVALTALAIELVKATQTDSLSIGNHGLSMLVFVVALILFLVVEGFATSTFFFVAVMALIDVLVGMTVTIITARRDFGGAPVQVSN